MKGKLARGVVWIAVSRIAINGIGLLSTLLLARLLLPEDFGLVAISTAIFAIVGSFTELSLGSALVHHRDPTDDHYHTAFTLGLLRGLLIGLVTAALAWPIAAAYGDDRLIGLTLALAAASVIAGLVNPRLAELLRALEFRQEFTLGVANKLVGFLVAAAVAFIWRSYWALVLGAIASQIANVVVSYVLVSYRPALSLAKTRELLSFSVWLTLSQVVMTLNYRFDTLFVGYFLGKTPLGYYSYGDNLANLVTREATTPVARTLFPAFAQMKDDPDRLRAAYFKAQGMLFAIALPVGVGFALIAEPLILLLLGEKWRGAIIVVQAIAAATGVYALASTSQSLGMALGRTRSLFNRDLASLVLRVPIVGLGLFWGGLIGVLVARTITGAIMLGLNMALIRSMIGVGFRAQIFRNWRPMVSGFAMVVVVYMWQAKFVVAPDVASQGINIIGQCVMGCFTYVATMWVVWTAAGRPEGIEREIEKLTSRLLQNLGVKLPLTFSR